MVEIVDASAEDEAAWEEFLEGSNNGTLFHSLRFLSYHGPGKVEQHPLILRDSGRMLALLPGGLVDGEEGLVFASPWGGSFGGWVLRGGESYDEMELLVDALLEWCRSRGVRRIDLALPPTFYLREPDQLAEFVILAKGFRRVGHEATDVIPLASGLDGVRGRWEASARKAVRKADSAGVIVRESRDVESFYPILLENRRRHGVRPTHSLEEVQRLFDLVPERLKLFTAEGEGRAIGGTLLFVCNARVFMNFYLCHEHEARVLRPADALMAVATRAAIEAGAQYFDLGTSSMGGIPNLGLMRFKEKFGARPFLRQKHRLELESP